MITLKDMTKEIGRELGMRRSLYPKWVAAKRMSQDEADTRIAVMDAVYQTLKNFEAVAAVTLEREARDTPPHGAEPAKD